MVGSRHWVHLLAGKTDQSPGEVQWKVCSLYSFGKQYTKDARCLCCFPEKKKPKRGRLSRDWRGRRSAIRLTNEHTVETLVVADADMVQYHGAEAAQRFILTVMNMVSLG